MTRSLPVLDWESIQGGGQILSWIAWGKSVGAMRGLVQQRAAIPSGLPGQYMKMLMQQDVHFCVSGLLAKTDNGCFQRVAQWESTNRAFPARSNGGAERSETFSGSLSASRRSRVSIWKRVLAAAVGPQNQVDHLIAGSMGALFDGMRLCFWSQHSLSDGDSAAIQMDEEI